MTRPTPASHPNADVRMRGFTARSTVDEALAWVDAAAVRLSSESVQLPQASGRVLAEPIASRVDVPRFARAMMDGFAVQATDTHGASPYNRLTLTEIGHCLPGRRFSEHLSSGQAVRIMTGAPVPAGADAVLPAELVTSNGHTVSVHGEVAPGKHVGQPGEDVTAGQTVLPAGRRLRPQDLGLLASIGESQVNVVTRPSVAIVVTGDELVPAGTSAGDCQVVDANGPMLAALAVRDGAVQALPTLVPDDPEAILAALQAPADVILVSGGSSVGQEDHVPRLLDQHGELAIHGVAMRPSSPVGMGRLQARLVFLLPGNPVSCLCAYDFFAGRALRQLGGLPAGWPYPTIQARLRRKLVSQIGRLDYARVQLVDGQVEPVAVSGASILSSTTQAEGFVVIPQDSEGYAEQTEVKVYLYDIYPTTSEA